MVVVVVVGCGGWLLVVFGVGCCGCCCLCRELTEGFAYVNETQRMKRTVPVKHSQSLDASVCANPVVRAPNSFFIRNAATF